MSKNKHIRKLITGQLRNIARHQDKIQKELREPTPNMDSIRNWEREIGISR